jgi:hypothetical protein
MAAAVIGVLVVSVGVRARARAQEHEAGAVAGPEHEAESEHAAEEGPLALSLDLVVGFGRTEIAEANRETAGAFDLASSHVTVESFVLSGAYELSEHIGLELRVPFAIGSLSATDDTSRTAFALGNLELGGEYELELSETLALAISLGVSLPTAQGAELPAAEGGEAGHASAADGGSFDHASINAAAAAARGFEDNALFEPERIGLIPKVGLAFHPGRVRLEPYVKVENLISTAHAAEHSYLGELVLGTFAGYQLSPALELGARVFGNLAFAGGGESVGVVEPQLRAYFGPLRLVLGGIIPFAGSLTDPQFGGVRLIVAARF